MAQPKRATRSASARPAVGGAYEADSRLYIDPALIPDGMELQWCREETLGEYDSGNITTQLNARQFVPVTKEEIPALAPIELPGRETKGSLIRRGGLVLMMRPKEIGVAERAARKASDEATLRAVNKELERDMDGKNFQRAEDSGVTVVIDRGEVPGSGKAFSDA